MERDITTHAHNRPPHLQVEAALNALLEGLHPGDQLPPEPALARELGVSRATLREVMRTFVERGLLFRRHGVGTFVSPRMPVLESGLELLESLDNQAHRIGLETTVAYLDIVERPATSEELAGLLLPAEPVVNVLCVSRMIAVAETPVAYLLDVVPCEYLRAEELAEGFRGSVLDFFLARGTPLLAYSRTEIMAEDASAGIAAKLGISRGNALLKLVAQLFSCDEKVVDYSLSYFVPGHFRFHVMRKVKK
jgi:GntR family transcriptional regulator